MRDVLKFLIGIAVIGMVTFLLSDKANAQIRTPDVIGVHLRSIHTAKNKPSGNDLGWNNDNVGMYLRWDNVVVGAYRNSLYQNSLYMGYMYEKEIEWSNHDRPVLGAIVGVVAGYDTTRNTGLVYGPEHRVYRCDAGVCRFVSVRSTILPFIVPSIRYKAVRLSLIPPAGSASNAALHLSLEWKL